MPVKIFIATHQPSLFPDDSGYVPLHVGKALSDVDLKIVGDDTGDNISNLNPFFCELTALYWIWKNCQSPVAGLVHYRRFFAAKNKVVPFGGASIAASDDFSEFENGIDLILLEPMKLTSYKTGAKLSNEEHYCECTIGFDLASAREAIELVDPSYLSYWDFLMRNDSCSVCNMIVARKNVLDEYCQWLFEVLFMLEKWIPYKSYDGFQRRVFGFLAERLLNVWTLRNRKYFRAAYRPMVFIP